MDNQRLTTIFIITFVILMHVLLFWTVFYQQPVKINTGVQLLNFVDLGQSTQLNHTISTSTTRSTTSKATALARKPVIHESKVDKISTIKMVEKSKSTENHFQIVKKTVNSNSKIQHISSETKMDTSSIPKMKQEQSSSSDSDQRNQSTTAAKAGDQPNNDSSTSNGSDLVVPKEYQGGFLAKLRPVYPTFSSENGEEGTVGITVSVAADGTPTTVTVSESSGYSRLDRAAKQAVQNYRFKPATRGGVAIAYKYHFNVKFNLNK